MSADPPAPLLALEAVDHLEILVPRGAEHTAELGWLGLQAVGIGLGWCVAMGACIGLAVMGVGGWPLAAATLATNLGFGVAGLFVAVLVLQARTRSSRSLVLRPGWLEMDDERLRWEDLATVTVGDEGVVLHARDGSTRLLAIGLDDDAAHWLAGRLVLERRHEVISGPLDPHAEAAVTALRTGLAR